MKSDAKSGHYGKNVAPRLPRLDTIDIARWLAALTIVAFHLDVINWHHNRTSFINIGDIGVDFFFVLSGFCIALSSQTGILSFLKNRAIRIFPALWVTVIGFTVAQLMFNATLPTNLIGSLLPYPSTQLTEPIIIWTLRHVILFYLFWALWTNGYRWVTIAWIAGCVCATISKYDSGVVSLIFSTYHLQFFMGVTVAIYRPKINPWIAISLALTFLMIQTPGRNWTLDYTSIGATWVVLWHGLCFALLLSGLAQLKFRAPEAVLLLCAASYEIYIIHAPAMGFAARFTNNSFILFAVGISAGVALHLFLQNFRHQWTHQLVNKES